MADVRKIALGVGPLVAVAVGVALSAYGLESKACLTAAVTALVAVWWVLEPIPVPATSLLPFALFPLLGILTHKQVAAAYGDTMILLMLGGFILSTALEHSGGHQRLAMGMVRLVGGRGGRRLVLGFMLASAVLSMWVSNTATALMLLPVAMAAIRQSGNPALATPLLLGVAYGASIGGIGTPIGTPPNIIFMGVYREAAGVEMSFAQWMKIGVPVVAAFLPVAWWWLTRGLSSAERFTPPAMGPWSAAEKRVLAVFAMTAAMWIFREEPAGGWSGLLGIDGYVHDSTVAMLMAAMLFIVPDGRGGRLLDWPTACRIPWGILILFGGGIAIAAAFAESGLSEAVGRGVSVLSQWPVILMILAICLAITFLTEVTSNTATATLLMPILAAAAVAAEVNPALFMAPAAISASCAFMLPVATPPNAIVFASGQITTATMARHGLALNIIGAIIITLVCYLLIR